MNSKISNPKVEVSKGMNIAISAALGECFSSIRPLGLEKWVFSMPISAARWFIQSTKVSTSPAQNPAIARAASLPDAKSNP